MQATDARERIVSIMRLLKTLVQKLPYTVPLATTDDKIAQVFRDIPEPTDNDEKWPTFNRRMDILFGEDVRGSNGRLLYILRGEHGMNSIVDYCQRCVDGNHLLWEAAEPKFARLVTELQKEM